uniref:Uncharacterized protein n=1 Tax=Fusarium oxysporum (strain Fo5176) TaxID=660025 RepID=A0A0D2YEG9_FUSOF
MPAGPSGVVVLIRVRKLFPPFMVIRRLMVWIVVVYCVCAYIVTISLQLFLCYPIQRNWYYRTIIFEIERSQLQLPRIRTPFEVWSCDTPDRPERI